jgi:outer membrane protein TolC
VEIVVTQGMALALDTLELTLAKLSYTQKIIAAKAALESDNEFLNNLTGQKIEVQPLLQYTFFANEDSYYTEKDERLQSLKIQQNIANLNTELATSSYYPIVALNAAYKYGDPGADIIQREWMSYGVWGVGIHWNLFRWGADKKAKEAGEAGVQELQYHYRVLNDNIKTEFDKTKRELKSLKEQLNVLATALQIAKEKLRLIDNRYKQGMASVTDYNDANLSMVETELKYKQFMSAVALKSNELDYKSGKALQQWRLEQ